MRCKRVQSTVAMSRSAVSARRHATIRAVRPSRKLAHSNPIAMHRESIKRLQLRLPVSVEDCVPQFQRHGIVGHQSYSWRQRCRLTTTVRRTREMNFDELFLALRANLPFTGKRDRQAASPLGTAAWFMENEELRKFRDLPRFIAEAGLDTQPTTASGPRMWELVLPRTPPCRCLCGGWEQSEDGL